MTHIDNSDAGNSGPEGADRQRGSAQKSRLRSDSWRTLPILPFEPTTPDEMKMVYDRLNVVFVSELHHEAIDWGTLEAVSAEISRLEKDLLAFCTPAN
jgi:hypothetical protein